MTKFHYEKIILLNNLYRVYMTNYRANPKENMGICYIYSETIAKEIKLLLEVITNRQNIKYWNRQTYKRVRQIGRVVNRINTNGHTYPIPFENLEAILGWKIAAWAVTEGYKRKIATFKLGIYEAKRYSSKTLTKECLLDDIKWGVEDPFGYIYNPEKGEYQQNPYNSQNNSPLFSTLNF